MTFDKRQTTIAKGVAVLLLLWHHLFYNAPSQYDDFVTLFTFRNIPVESFIADFCKVCVAIFLFLSGYGLFKSYHSYMNKNSSDGKLPFKKQVYYVKNHLIKLLSSYWFVFVIFVPLGLFFGKPFYVYYGFNPVYYLTDFFGVNYLFFGMNGTMNVTWWFMSIIIVFYIIFPVLYRIQKYSPEVLLVIASFIMFMPIPDFRELKIWVCPFVLGMYVSRYNVLNKLGGVKLNTIPKSLICCILSVLMFAYLRYEFLGVQIDSLFGLSVIFFSFLVLSRIPILNKFLYEMGKYSASIFMFHTFIIGYYFKDLIYWFKYSVIIFAVTIVVCYFIARILEWLMHITRYNKLISKLSGDKVQ